MNNSNLISNIPESRFSFGLNLEHAKPNHTIEEKSGASGLFTKGMQLEAEHPEEIDEKTMQRGIVTTKP